MSDDAFLAHRGLLFTIAYEMLGSAADAEDVVQDTWLRWAGVHHGEVRDPRAYLVRIVTRLALNRLRALTRRREDYIGEWLPEPLLTSPDISADIELSESLSIAMLAVLETLGPVERAVFVLGEVFDVPHDEIARAIDKSPAAVRQIAHRARKHVAALRPRMPVTSSEHREAVERFLGAVRGGQLQDLLDVLAPDVVAVADGGGFVAAARHPMSGAQRVAGLLVRAARSGDLEMEAVSINGSLGALITVAGTVRGAMSACVEDSRITRLYSITNPHKLVHLQSVAAVARS